MPHAKFQSPSINIDRDFQLSARERKGERKKGKKVESNLVREGPKM